MALFLSNARPRREATIVNTTNAMKTTAVLLSLTVISSLAGCDRTQSKENIALASRYFTEVYNEGNVDLIDELFADNYTHTTTSGNSFTGRDKLKEIVPGIKSSLPGLKCEIVETIAADEKVMLIVNFRADFPEPFKTESSPQHVAYPEVFVFWVEDGEIKRGRTVGGTWELIRQAAGFEGSIEDAAVILTRAKSLEAPEVTH